MSPNGSAGAAVDAAAPASAVPALVDHLFRRQSARLVAALARTLGPAHLDLAEDLVQDALLRALRTWPFRGVPDDPAAWLFQVARNRALDAVRHTAALQGREADVERRLYAGPDGDGVPGGAGDDELALLFACCHPAVPRDAGVALALRTVGGLGVGEIARAFLVEPAAVAQRLVRAKRRLRASGAVVEVPASDAELAGRLPGVLDALYLVFTEGASASEGDDAVRVELCAEALRLARLVAAHPATARPEAHALVALMAFHAARLPARLDSRLGAGGDPVLLADQDRARWDAGLVALGFRHLARSAAGPALTRYHVEAEIASHHARAPSVAATDWAAVLAAYDVLLDVAPSPVARVHRAVAVGMVHGPAAALADLAEAAAERAAAPGLARYVWFHVTRAHWLAEAGARDEAAAAYRRALALAAAAPLRRTIAARLLALGGGA